MTTRMKPNELRNLDNSERKTFVRSIPKDKQSKEDSMKLAIRQRQAMRRNGRGQIFVYLAAAISMIILAFIFGMEKGAELKDFYVKHPIRVSECPKGK